MKPRSRSPEDHRARGAARAGCLRKFGDTRPRPLGQDRSAGVFQQFLPRVPSLPPFQPGPPLRPSGKDLGPGADWSQPGEGTQKYY